MVNTHKKDAEDSGEKARKKRSIVDFLYVKLLKDPSTNVIVSLISFVFIVWMVIPLLLVLSGAVYYDGGFSGAAVNQVFTDEVFFNLKGDPNTYLYEKSEVPLGGPSDSVVYSNGILYSAERSEGIEVLNISIPENITEIYQYYEDTSAISDLATDGSYLYAAAGRDGLIIFNISNPSEDMTKLSQVSIGVNQTTSFIEIKDGLAYVGKDEEAMYIIDITDVNNPIIQSSIPFETKIESVAIKEDIAFLVGYSTGIVMYNISNPSNPQYIGSYTEDSKLDGTIRSKDIEIKDDIAYVCLKSDGFAAFNISDITNISLVSYISNVYGYNIKIHGNYAFVGVEDINLNDGLRIINIENPQTMNEISNYISPLLKTKEVCYDPDTNLIFLAEGRSGVYILDASNIDSIILVNSYNDTKTITIHTFSGVNRGVVLNTIILGVVTTFFSIILGTALAFVLARYEFFGKKLFSLLALAPLIVPPFISGMGFRLLLGPTGFLNSFVLEPMFGAKIIINGFIAICFVQVSHFYALVYLNAFSSFLNIDPSMEESAENLGASSFKLFRTVTLPLAMPGIGAGSILVLILSMEDVGTPLVFANMADDMAKNYLTYYIFENFQKAGSVDITPTVLVLGALLLVIALIGFFMIRKYVSLRKYSMISKGRAGEYRMSEAGWKGLIIYPFLILLFSISLLVHIGIFLMSIMKTLGSKHAYKIEFTAEFYRSIFTSETYEIGLYIRNTLLYSFLAAIVIIILGSLAAYVMSRKEFKGKNLFDALVTIPIAIPGMVLAIGYYRTFNFGEIARTNPNWFTLGLKDVTTALRLDPIVGGAVVLLVLGYTIRKFPFTVRAAYAGLQQTDPVLDESSFNLGAGKVKTFLKITIPLISLNILAGALVSFVFCLSEVSTTIFLIMNFKYGTVTWLMAWNPLQFQLFCALGVVLMVIQIMSLFITNIILGSRAEAITGI